MYHITLTSIFSNINILPTSGAFEVLYIGAPTIRSSYLYINQIIYQKKKKKKKLATAIW